MKYNYLAILVFLIVNIGFAQPITVSTTQYTPEQLVTDILINNPCANVSNISWSTGTTHGVTNGTGIGYFENTNPDFDMAAGVVLNTGNVNLCPGPSVGNQNVGSFQGWPDDAELTTYLNGVITPSTYQNATVLEFDFVPYTDAISFSFIFASEEYGGAQCAFSDAFAFFLTNTVTNVTTNLALIPNTNLPISVTTIRDNANNAGCSSENEEYFDSFNVGTASAINFRGQTVKMLAASEVVPFNTYHIKLVID
ncbi:MAG: choice-of-anchor L domain-containing protein [Myroides sp.]|nr:choice-of-anchor L domain-containing protein [Myroides sp.]